jgi:hypothetical protein
MTRQEHLDQLNTDLRKARAYGDRLKANEIILEIYDLEKVKDEEYEAYIRVSKMYGSHSVISGIQSGKISK